jgi:hypothetical protein
MATSWTEPGNGSWLGSVFQPVPACLAGSYECRGARCGRGVALQHVCLCALCAAGTKAKKDERSLLQILWQECLRSPYIWLFALTYFFVYVIRQVPTPDHH